jgi:hypothetical protein
VTDLPAVEVSEPCLVKVAGPGDLQTLAGVTRAARAGNMLLLVAPDLETLDETLDGGDD